MKATIRTTTHANLAPGDPVEVTGYCAKVTATWDSATPNAKPVTEEREVFFGLGELSFDVSLEAALVKSTTGVCPEIPADLPLSLPSTGFAPESPTAPPQSPEKAYLADILLVMRNIHELLIEYIQSHP